jgi:hypothetical protein
LLDQLRAEPDIKARRKMLQNGQGHVIGAFIRAIERVRVGHSEASRVVEEPFVGQMIGSTISEVLALCDLTLADMPKAS